MVKPSLLVCTSYSKMIILKTWKNSKDKADEMRWKDVITIICDMHDLGIWKIICFWSKSSMGNIKVFSNSCTAAGNFNRHGSRWDALYCISDFDCGWNCSTG